MAFYPDTRMVSIEASGTPFSHESIQAVVTDPAVADLVVLPSSSKPD